ncbi:TonB-dependent receptor [Vibrio alfacsensis]|uniref:TonB-dependent receptor n=1 Tax=Vibrio alfacsensis TaxID=1074311 RepID=A0ABM6YZX8_9VIBR|nr:TonB-dependent receptor [Vibrio alfacsensis]AXY03490.1 TonB-dependent receptor [Vibrio alfacsensis]
MKLRSLFLACSCLFTGVANADSISLPIWKEEAEALGYNLPKPFGLNLSYMSMEQGINVNSIALKNVKLGPLNLDGLPLEAGAGKQATDVMTLRADVWLFPFLNLYGLVGTLDGYSETTVKLKAFSHTLLETPFRLDLDGYTYGGGFVLAGGYKQLFALVDASYTQTNLNVIDGAIDAIVVSPRIGYDFNNHGVPVRFWVGTMYQNVEQELSGTLKQAGINLSGRFEVKQQLTSEWNTIAGMQYQFNEDWYLLGEAGFGDRKSIFFSIDRRF